MNSNNTNTSTNNNVITDSEWEDLIKEYESVPTPVSVPEAPVPPNTPRHDLEDLDISDIDIESPVLARTRTQEIIDLTKDVSSISSSEDSLYNAIIQCE